MGGSIQYVYRDGSRLTPWMLFVINRASAELHERFGCELLVTSGIRTNAEQTAIFLDKYRVQLFGSGPYKDVRWWKGKRYVRVKGGGTVAPPSKSNHEIQGSKAAADLRDSGRDAGVSRGGNARANWLRANAPRLGLIASGYGFGEPWHYDIPDIFRTPPATPAGGNQTPIAIPTLFREEPDMATGVIYTDDTADKNRSGAIVDTQSGLFSDFGWFPKTYADGLAKGFGLPQAGQVTRGQYDQIRKDMAELRARKS